MNLFGRKNGLLGFMLAKNIYCDNSGFATRGILTNTMKLIRFEARQYYKEHLEAMYKEGELKV